MRFVALLLLAVSTLSAQQPAALLIPMPVPEETIPLWPDGTPEPSKLTGPEYDPTGPKDANVGGIQSVRVTNVSKPSLLYACGGLDARPGPALRLSRALTPGR